MKTRCLVLAVLLVALLAATSAPAQTAPQFIRQFGSVDYDYAVKTTIDTQGNVYVAGMTRSTLDAPSQAVPNRNSGGADIFVAKFDPRGDLLWVTQFGSAADDSIGGIAVGTQNGFLSLFVAGSTLGDMPGGADGYVNVSAGGSDLFLAKIHPESGTLRWVRQYGTSGDDVAQGIAVDVSCMVFLAGSTTGSLDGTAAPGNVEAAFLMKLNASGDRMGSFQFNIDSNPLGSAARAVAVESRDRANPIIYVAGSVPGNEQGSLFVARISWDLDLLGLARLGGPNRGSDNDRALAMAVDGSRNVVVAGSSPGNFEGGVSSGAEDIIVVKFDRLLNLLWARQYGTDGHDAAYGVAVDAEGSIYVTGVTESFGAGRGLDGQASMGGADIFLSRLAPEDGRRVFTRQIGTAYKDYGYGVVLDPSGAVYVAGLTEGTLGEQNYGLWDAVLIKYGPDGAVPRPVTEFFINGTVQEIPSGSGLGGVSVTVKDELGQVQGEYTTDSAGRFTSKVSKAGRYFIHKLKIGYRAPADPDEVTVTEQAPSAAAVFVMERIVAPTSMAFRKGYNSVRFEKLPAADRSVQGVFGPYAGNPYVGLIFSFDRPMQFLILAKPRSAGNLKALEFGRSYLVYTSRAFTIDTTNWVEREAVPATALPAAKYRGKVSR